MTEEIIKNPNKGIPLQKEYLEGHRVLNLTEFPKYNLIQLFCSNGETEAQSNN